MNADGDQISRTTDFTSESPRVGWEFPIERPRNGAKTGTGKLAGEAHGKHPESAGRCGAQLATGPVDIGNRLHAFAVQVQQVSSAWPEEGNTHS